KGVTAIKETMKKKEIYKYECKRMGKVQITHISSLNDIIPAGIVDETGKDYKLKIGSLSTNFFDELEHPIWGENITKLFLIIREGHGMFVWVNRLQVRYFFHDTV
ncbi:hypothetical protein PFISCL1PPCAC_26906, partial [Pristionchus fissidentatus]